MSDDHIGKSSAEPGAEAVSDSLMLERGMEIVAHVRDAASGSEELHAESMLHTIIRNMQEVVLLLDRDLHLIEASKSAVEVMELPPEPRNVCFTPEINVGHVTDGDGNPIPFDQTLPRRILRGERLDNELLVWKFKDGSLGHFMVNGTPIHNSAGEIEMALLVGRDISELRELQLRTEKMVSELSWSRRNLRRLVDNMAVGVIFLDSELRILEANRAYSRQFASSVKLRRGMPINEALPLATESGMVDLLKSALKSEKPVQVKCFRYDGLPGGTTYWNGSAVPVRTHRESGLELSLAMVLVDVTDEIEARDRLSELATLRAKRTRELEAERARLDTVIQSTPIPLVVVDTQGCVVTHNAAAAAVAEIIGVSDWMCGVTAWRDVPGLVVTDQYGHKLGCDGVLLNRTLRGETCVDETIDVRCGGKPPRSLNINCAPLKDAHGNVTGIVLAAQDITEQLRAQQRIDEIYQREHTIAEKLQSSLMPGEFPRIEGFEIGQCYRSALDEALVGGDFYDIFRIGEGRLGVVIADVAGKGLKAAVYTAMTKYMLRAYALEESAPGLVLTRLNEALTECTPTEVFVTLVYGVLDSESGVFRYANAGHEQPVLLCGGVRMAYTLDVTGRALALTHGSTYTACDAVMRPGDALVLYTDGITDAGWGTHRMGTKQLLRTVEAGGRLNAADLADAVLGRALEYAEGNLTDDAAIMVIKALQAEVEG